MTVSGERYYRLMDGDTLVSRHQSVEEAMERAVAFMQAKGKGTHSLTLYPPVKTIKVTV